jgi:uncharacterized protein (DUF924 family)
MDRSRAIRSYWFEGVNDSTIIDSSHACYRRWFGQKPDVDAHIVKEFKVDVELARAGTYDDWRATPSGNLALVLLLDQFPRHIFRGDRRAFESDEAALAIAKDSIASRADDSLAIVERVFLYLPLQHSEQMADHEVAQERFAALVALADQQRAGIRGFCEKAVLSEIEHIDVLRRFGRYPYRNAALGRACTPMEEAYLRAPDENASTDATASMAV